MISNHQLKLSSTNIKLTALGTSSISARSRVINPTRVVVSGFMHNHQYVASLYGRVCANGFEGTRADIPAL